MKISQGYLPESALILAALLYAVILALALWRAPWSNFKEEKNLHIFLGVCVSLTLLWTIRAATIPGLGYHYFGATLLTLMFGWPLAIVGNTLVQLGNVINGAGDWQSLPANLLVLGVVPVLVSHAILKLSERWLPHNYFIYLFVCAYFGAAFAFIASSLVTSTVLVLGPQFTAAALAAQFFPLVLLMAFPEAFITGLLVAMMTVYLPGWVRTFDDDVYIRDK